MLHRRPAFLVAVALALCAGFTVLIWNMNRSRPVAPVVAAGSPALEARESPKAEAPVQPPVLEPAPAPQAPTPETRTPAAGGVAQAAAITLKVEVVDERGAAITTGELECSWGRPGFRITDVDGHVRVPIEAASTLIRLPKSAIEALVVARDGVHAPAQVRVQHLRRRNGKPNGKWIADDESVTHDVRIELPSSGPPANGIWGTIFVDDVPRTPAGLTIQAEMTYESMVAAIPASEPSKIPRGRTPESAVIDATRNEYRLAAPEKGTWTLKVKSEETLANWRDASVNDSSIASRVDLHLTTGAAVVIHARDAPTGAAVPALELRLSFWQEIKKTKVRIPGESSDRMSTLGESIDIDAITDATGACTFRGLPRDVRLYFRKRASTGADTPLLELKLLESDPREVHHDLWVNGPDPTMSTCWGYLPESIAAMEFDDDSPVTLAAFNIDDLGGSKRVDVAESKWTVVLPANKRFELSLSHGPERLTVKREIKTQAGMQGPIELIPVKLVPFRFAWTNAPVGCKLELQGAPGRQEMLLAEREGSIDLQRPSDNGLSVKVNGHDGGFLSMGWAESALSNELSVDLMGDRQLTVVLQVNGAASGSSDTLRLYAFEPAAGAAYAFASIPMQAGKCVAVPLCRGPHFFSMFAPPSGGESPSAAVVTGIVELPGGTAAAGSTVKIDWHGQSLSAAEWSALGKSGFMVTRCGERDLLPIKEPWRRYRFKDLNLAPDTSGTAPALLFDRENCRTVAWDD